MHSPHVVKKWLHGAKRVAVLGHEAEPNDEILANVDRMVRKRDVPRRLKDQWKPIKLNPAVVAKKPKGAAEQQAKAAEKVLERVGKDVADELRRELDDVELDLEKIVAKAYVIERGEAGRVAVPCAICRIRGQGRQVVLGGGPSQDSARGNGGIQPQVGRRISERSAAAR